jgi:hypothetical protein
MIVRKRKHELGMIGKMPTKKEQEIKEIGDSV